MVYNRLRTQRPDHAIVRLPTTQPITKTIYDYSTVLSIKHYLLTAASYCIF